MLAILGRQSSLLSLMARTQDSTAGQVFYGGQDVRMWTAQQRAGERSVMWQDNRLLRGSVRWNLTQGRTGTGGEHLQAQLAALDLPPGLLDEPGTSLDRGNARRVADLLTNFLYKC